jgi:PAS domain S-box-containing protein
MCDNSDPNQSIENYRSIFNNSLDAILLTHPDGSIFYANSAAEDLFGYTQKEIYDLGRSGIVDIEDPNLPLMLEERTREGKSRGELTFIKKDGTKFPGDISTSIFNDEKGNLNTFMIIRDISRRKNVEKSLKESEERYHSLFENNHAVMLLINPNTGEIVDANAAASSFYGYNHEELVKMKINDINLLPEEEVFNEMRKSKLAQKNNFIFKHKLANGEMRDVDVYSGSITVGGKNLLYSIIHDITKRKQVENELQTTLERFYNILSFMNAAVLLVTSENRTEFVNQAFCNYYDLKEEPSDLVGLSASEMIKKIKVAYKDPEKAVVRIREIVDDWKPVISEEIPMRNGHTCLRDFVPIFVRGEHYGRLWLHLDITEQKSTEDKLKKTKKEILEINSILKKEIKDHEQTELKLRELVTELKRSNKELEQFAYISSHDLQEPLRMVALFTQLLERRYKGKLDSDADDYINFIVEGAQRMKLLIDDLLAYSRVNTKGGEFESVDLDNVMNTVLSNLHLFSEENKAEIIIDEPLPTIRADPSQMVHIFQNLITNGIKFNDKKTPKIHISAQINGNEWVFKVSDNGIGIATEYQEKIFEIFKRLHDRQEYPGTGIGLAICQKIIERHGGKIWVESEMGKSSTFYFNIPDKNKSTPSIPEE